MSSQAQSTPADMPEWERIQRKTYTNWANFYLRHRDLKINTIETDLADGIMLINLYEILTGNTIEQKWNRNPRLRVAKIENISIALQHFRDFGVKANFEPMDIERGNRKVILSLMWATIVRLQINRGDDDEEGGSHGSGRDVILDWCQNYLHEYPIPDLKKNSPGCFQDGDVLLYLVHKTEPSAVDLQELKQLPPLQKLQAALDAAERLGVPKLLDAEDIVKSPDENSILTYLSAFKQIAEEYNKNKQDGEETRRLLELKAREEEEKRRAEEEEQQRLRALEDDRRRREEEERRRKEEEDRRQREEEERRRREEEERRRKEEEDRRKREEEERQRREEEERRRREEEERRRREEEERRRREEEERRRREEEARRQLEAEAERLRKEKEELERLRREKEEEERRRKEKEEADKRRLEEEKAKLEEELKRMREEADRLKQLEIENSRNQRLKLEEADRAARLAREKDRLAKEMEELQRQLQQGKGSSAFKVLDDSSFLSTPCLICQKPLSSGKTVLALTLAGDQFVYHLHCFVCVRCKKPFSNTFYQINGKPYCSEHYSEAKGWFCFQCGQIIDDNPIQSMDKLWHTECFVCGICKKPFNGPIYKHDGKVICQQDLNKIKGAKPNCCICERAIFGTPVAAFNNHFHEGCFCCTSCGVILEPNSPSSFKNQNGKPICQGCSP